MIGLERLEKRGLRQISDPQQIVDVVRLWPQELMNEFEQAAAQTSDVKSGMPRVVQHLRTLDPCCIKAVSEIRITTHLDNALTAENAEERQGDAPKPGGRRSRNKVAKKDGE